MKVLVVGAGLFGSLVTTALRSRGDEVTLVDRKEMYAGSGPAACLCKPGWYAGLGKDVYQPALNFLDEFFEIKTLDFAVGPKTIGVQWVDPLKIRLPSTELDFKQFVFKGTHWSAELHDAEQNIYIESFDSIVLATGVWTNALVPGARVKALAGAAFTWKTNTLPGNRISVWAPFKQLVRFERSPGELWVGDGMTWNGFGAAPSAKRLEERNKRCQDFSEQVEHGTTHIGFRPLVDDASPCLLQELQPRLWLVTGGAKNGTIAAAWAANRLRSELL